MIHIPEVALGAIAAALIAGLVSLLGLVISKEQKISDFRQAWIDALRSELSATIAHANSIHGAVNAGYTSPSKLWEVVRPDYVRINEAAAAIRLRLNPSEKEALAVLSKLQELEELLSPGRAPDYTAIDKVEKDLVAEAQALLKKEWLVVKHGEPVFRAARLGAVAVVIASIVSLVAVAALWLAGA